MNRRNVIAAGVAGVSAVAVATKASAADENPELDKIRALLSAHDKAMTSHDLDGVLACLAEKPSLMGTGPGEFYSGMDDVKVAYEHFFMVFDKGEQDFEYHVRVGGLSADMGWLLTSGDVKGKRDGKDFAYPLNVSLTVAKNGDDWKIAAMHFSTLTGAEEA